MRLARDLSPEHVGNRVVVRRRLAGGGLGDVLGELLAWENAVLRVRAGDGSVVEIAEADVAGGKPVPPAAHERTSPEELEEIAALGWPALESEWLGRWWLRAAEGFTGRANSVLPLGDPGVGLEQALAFVERWYGERGLPPTAMVVLDTGIDRELDRRGWQLVAPSFSHRDVLVQAAPLATAVAGLEQHAVPDVDVRLEREPDEEWLSLYRAGTLPPVALRVLAHPEARFATVRLDGRLAAIGRAVLVRRWVGLSALEVAPHARRRGLGTAVVAALLRDAGARGARASYLQVTAENDAAFALYGRLGFRTHHRYGYRSPAG